MNSNWGHPLAPSGQQGERVSDESSPQHSLQITDSAPVFSFGRAVSSETHQSPIRI